MFMTPEMISGLVALAGVALGGAIGFYSSLYTNKRVQVEMASNDLRNCFLPVIMKINTSGFASETELRNFAVDRFEQHALAIEAFRFYVPPQKKRAYEQAYREYHNMCTKRPINHGSSLGHEEFYLKTVNAILHFAEPQ